MAKKVAGTMKLQVPAGQANPSPPVGPALGQRGINIMEFCKAFNAKTQDMEPGAPCPTVITYYVDKSFPRNRRLGHDRPASRDRRGKNERPQRERCRSGDEDHPWLCQVDGH